MAILPLLWLTTWNHTVMPGKIANCKSLAALQALTRSA
uniref:Uncharacterized protein n=1 Tax=Arundo donax TaxID=35708 RepID=A0A0A9ED95_ARUDO